MNRKVLLIILLAFLLLAGCGTKGPSKDSPSQPVVIFDISGTYEEFTKTYYSVTLPNDETASTDVSVTYGTVTPGKELITDVIFDGTNVSFTPATNQGIGAAWITLTAGDYEQTTFIKVYDLSRRLIALDFDDGPSEFTDDILDTLIETGYSATFYVTGKAYQDVRCVYVGAELYPNTLIREVQSGQHIGNHTYDHPWRIMAENGPPNQTEDWMDYSASEVKEQVQRLDDLLIELVGFAPDYFAAPYGRDVHLSSLNKLMSDRTVHYNDTSDWVPETPPIDIAQRIMYTPSNMTVLMHDVYEATAEGLRIALTSDEAEKIQFMTTYELEMIREYMVE